MRHALFLGAVEAGALQNDIDIKLAPRALSCVLAGINFNFLAVNDDGILRCADSVQVFADLAAVTALCGIVLQQVCKHCGAGQVVDCNNLISLSTEHLTESKATDAAETIDSYFNRHFFVPPKQFFGYLFQIQRTTYTILHKFRESCKREL